MGDEVLRATRASDPMMSQGPKKLTPILQPKQPLRPTVAQPEASPRQLRVGTRKAFTLSKAGSSNSTTLSLSFYSLKSPPFFSSPL